MNDADRITPLATLGAQRANVSKFATDSNIFTKTTFEVCLKCKKWLVCRSTAVMELEGDVKDF